MIPGLDDAMTEIALSCLSHADTVCALRTDMALSPLRVRLFSLAEQLEAVVASAELIRSNLYAEEAVDGRE